MGFFEDIVGGLIGAGTKILGGKMSEDSANERAAANIAAQKEFAQQGVSWKVADAKRAGISPLAALGASTNSFSNVVGGEGKLGEALSDSSQDISRAAGAAFPSQQKAMLIKGAQLDLERKGLENDVLRADLASRIQKVGAAGNPPGIASAGAGAPYPGTGNTGGLTAGVPVVPEDTEKMEGGYTLFGRRMAPDPYMSDANQIQNIFGDWGENAWAMPKFIANLLWNAELWLDEYSKQHGRPRFRATQ